MPFCWLVSESFAILGRNTAKARTIDPLQAGICWVAQGWVGIAMLTHSSKDSHPAQAGTHTDIVLDSESLVLATTS